MKWWDWLKSLFRARPPRRDVSGLGAAASSSDAGLTQEVVDTQGGPLKPAHRRRVLRDSRLLPKPKAKITSWPRSKKPKYLSRDEADRLFSATLRTSDRNIRDLTTDDEQLQRYGLPLWNSEEGLAAALGLTVKQLRHFSIHRQRETSPHYVAFVVPKRGGGQRLIHAPKRRLKQVQRTVHRLLVSKLPAGPHAHGFLPRRSVATNARPHAGKAVVIKLDLADCFPSIHYGRVRGLLMSLGYGYPVATVLAVLMTEPPRQPVDVNGVVYHVPVGPRVCVQGAPTSPGLCNAVLVRMDRRIAGLARKHGFTYTRYADDLTLSGDDSTKIKLLITIAARIVREDLHMLNPKQAEPLKQALRRVTR